VKPFDGIVDKSRSPIVNAYLRWKLVAGIEAELKQADPSASAPRPPSVNRFLKYVPTPAFRVAIHHLVRRHAGPIHATPSLTGQPALDAKSLSAFLAYAKLEHRPELEHEIGHMRKQASLSTGIEIEQIEQILCKIVGAPAVIPLDANAPPVAAASSSSQPATDTSPTSSSSTLPTISPPYPEYEHGAYWVSEFLLDAGFDLNLQPHIELNWDEALRLQQPTYWRTRTPEDKLMNDMDDSDEADTDAGTGMDAPTDHSGIKPAEFISLLYDIAERQGEADLLSMAPTQLCVQEQDWDRVTVALDSMRRSDENAPKTEMTAGLPLSALRLRFLFLRLFNSLFSTLLPLIDLRRTVDPRSIAGLLHRTRPFLFPSVKSSFMASILDATAEEIQKPPRIQLNRTALAMARGRGQHIDFMQASLYAKTFEQLNAIDPFKLRPMRPAGTEPFLCFEVSFQGEQVVGEGGPFRQIFSDLATELQDPSNTQTGLLHPTPNQSNKIGNDRDKFCLRPGANTAQHLAYFEFMGVLFGCCLRTGVRFPVDLATATWKSLLHEDLTLTDLYALDQASMESLHFIRGADAETLEAMQQPFTTKLSDGTVAVLIDNGEQRMVSVESREEYVGLCIAARMVESQAQVEAIRRGIAKIVPLQLLNLLTSRDLELAVCGRTTIDIDLLRRHTKYSGVDGSAPHIQYLWQALSDMDEHEKRLFIRFCWAQERLPLDDAEFVRTHTRFLIKPPIKQYDNPDQALPRSDTCFFNLELPPYSSLAVMRSRLHYAIHADTTMNADEKSLRDAEEARGNNRGRRNNFMDGDDYDGY